MFTKLFESRQIQWYRAASTRSVHFGHARKLSWLGKRLIWLEFEACVVDRDAPATTSASACSLI